MKSKRWSLCFLALTLSLLFAAALLTGIIDPFFHYHAPLESLEYPLNNQRYQNDGIVRHFEYDALITGTSLTENFKTSEMDALFGTKSVKTCFSGGTYEEITFNLRQALESGNEIRYVIYGLDEWNLFAGRDLILADGEYPTYLYDDNPFNDVNYLFNKEILLENTLDVLSYTRSGNVTTSFDAYSAWRTPTGAAPLLESYDRPEVSRTTAVLTEDLKNGILYHLETNLLALARQYPDTQFLYFFPPYSMLNWDMHHRDGAVAQYVEAFQVTTEALLQAENIQLYSFYTDHETILNPDNYRDTVHYSPEVNSLLLRRMARGEYRLTLENYEAHWQEVLDYYQNFDYDALIAQWEQAA